MKIKITLFFVLVSLSLFSQSPGWIWANSAGGNSYDDAGSVRADNSGNVYVTGTFFNDTIIFGTDTLRTTGLTDMYLVKYNSSGNVIWVKQEGGTSDDYFTSVTTDLWGNIYAVGTFSSSSITFGTTTLLNSSIGFPDIFIVKYDSNGNVIWAKKEGQADYDYASCVATDPVNGEIYLAGCHYAGNITVGTTTLTNNGLYDVMLIKYDTAGNVLWAIGSGGTLNDMGNAVSVDKARNVYISGGFASSSMMFGLTTLTNAGPGFPDIFIAKFDTAGNSIWAKREGGGDNDHSVTVANDTSCNVFVGGHFHSTSFGFGSGTLTNAGMGDLFLLKYDSAGNAIWGNAAGGMDHDFGYTVTVDPAGNSYYAGMFISMNLTFGSTTLTNASMDEDMFIVKYDPAGNVVWAINAGGSGRDFINSVSVNIAGNLYVAGTMGSISMMASAITLTNTDTSGTTYDAFVGKLDVITGFFTEMNNESISIYPNPSNGKFYFSTGISQATVIEIYNTLGELIYNSTITNPNSANEFDLSGNAAGIYFMKISSEEKTQTRKIILNK